MARLDKKIAVITGGNSGIGLAAAKVMQREGAEVVITGRDQSKLDAAVAELGGNALAIKSDVANLSEIDQLMDTVREKFGRIDILFANAGLGKVAPLTDATEEHYDLHMDINVKGLFFTVQKALPLLPDGASVILNASIAKEKGFPGLSVYTATKAAVRSFARTWTSELQGRRIRVNSISPGPIETAFYEKMDLAPDAVGEFASSVKSQVPLGDFGESADIAEAVLYLASDESKFTTGIDLVVDGGLSQV